MAGLLIDGLAWQRLVRPGLPDRHGLAMAAPAGRIVPGVTMSRPRAALRARLRGRSEPTWRRRGGRRHAWLRIGAPGRQSAGATYRWLPAAGTKTRAADPGSRRNLPVVLMAGWTPPAWRPMRVKSPASGYGGLADSGTGDRQAAIFRPAVVVVDGGDGMTGRLQQRRGDASAVTS